MRAGGYISSSRLGYEVGENIAWGTLRLATPARDRGRLDGLARTPREHPRPRFRDTGIGVSAHPPSALAHGQPGAIYTQDFGVIIGG